MQFYKTPGSPVSLSQCSVSAVATLVAIVANSQTYNCPLTVEASRQTTKNGTVRVMLKASLTHPRFTATTGGDVGAISSTSNTEVTTVHLVLTAAPSLVLTAGIDAWQAGVVSILHNLVGAIVATAGENVSIKSTSLSASSPLWLGLSGIFPLNLTNGVYGAAT